MGQKQNGGRGDVFASFAPTKDKDWLLSRENLCL
jgi:hypothetical protein